MPEQKKFKTLTMKYLKKDKFNNFIFLASNDDELIKQSYIKLKKYHKSISTKHSGSNPVWYVKEKKIATLRVKKSEKLVDLKELAFYEIIFNFYETKSNGKTHCSVILENIKFIKPHDTGSIAAVDSDCDISNSEDENL